MNKKIRDLLFFIIVFSLIFNNIPEPIQMNFIGGPVGNKLVFYPLFIGFIYTGYCNYKYKNIFVDSAAVQKFLIFYLGTTLISLIIGLFNYPYWDLITNGPSDQIQKLPKVVAMLKCYNIEFDVKIISSIWLIVRMIKGLVLEFFFTFGGSYMIYCWYRDDWESAFNILCKSILSSLIIVFSYSMIELFYLASNDTAKLILETITPYLHTIKTGHGWWPPLLWKNQIRSVFAEPSFFSIWAAFALPFLWYHIKGAHMNRKEFTYSLILIFFTFLIFMTKARTGVALLLGEFILLIVYSLFYLRSKNGVRAFSMITICTVIGFLLCNIFINDFMGTKKAAINSYTQPVKKVTASDYLEDNVGSIFSMNKRSNIARYSTIIANVKIGLDNPILGVGRGMVPAYMPDYFPIFSKENWEVRNWIKYQCDKGVLRMGIPSFSAYSIIFAESGFLGLLLYLLPAMVVVYNLCKRIILSINKIRYMVVLIAILGILASGFSNTLNITYCYWVLMGLGFAMCFGKQVEKLNNE